MPEHIEREAGLIELCRGCSLHGIAPNFFCGDACPKYKRVAAVPAADVQPVVRAHWFWDKDGMDWGIGAWRCSACKAMSPMWWNTDKGSPMHKSGHKFCPNCGADMREKS